MSTDIIIVRKKVIDKAVIGLLVTATGEAYSTMENADKLVDPGFYTLTFTYSPRFSNKEPYKVFKPAGKKSAVVPLICVKGRDGIRIHIGNFSHQSDGCILIGYNGAPHKDVVKYSTEAYSNFMSYCRERNYNDMSIQIMDVVKNGKNDD